jgi:LemA protein
MNPFGVGFSVFVIVLAVAFVGLAISTYNALISLQKQTERAWANIDVILKQRFDVIPQLITICEQFTTYENDTIKKLVEARTRYGQAATPGSKMQAEAQLSTALKGLIAIGEAYPVLKSSEQFLQIQHTISDLERQLADRREVYNESVTNFNTRIEQIPDVFFARSMGCKPFEFFKVAENEKQVPSLKIKTPA